MGAINKIVRLSIRLILALGYSTTGVASERDAGAQLAAIDEPYVCSQNIRQALRQPLAAAPDFTTIHEVTRWLAGRLPASIQSHFVEAGRAVYKSLNDWERHRIINGPFWNLQALGELIRAQDSHFVGIFGCSIRDESGVTFQVLQDQIYIVLDLKGKSVDRALTRLGISDPHYAKMAIMYGVILDYAKISWRDDQLARLVKFHLELEQGGDDMINYTDK